MKVYMIGLIYFDGCDATQRHAYAPDGRDGVLTSGIPHYASLWIRREDVNTGATNWPSQISHTFDGVPFIEFRIATRSVLEFPDQGSGGDCGDLEKKLPKLKKKKHGQPEEDFEVDPDTMQTIAALTIRGGGDIEPRRFNDAAAVEWTIATPSGTTINGGASGTIVLNTAAAEIVFANMHEVSDTAKRDDNEGSHIGLFQRLNPSAAGEILESKKAVRDADKLSTGNRFINHLDDAKWTCGVTPPCCKTLQLE